MKYVVGGLAALSLSMAFSLFAFAGEKESEKYALRYKFHPNETLRWEVEHRSMVRATVSGTTQDSATLSTSIKAWQVTDVQPDGTATIEHRVEWVDMRQKLTGRAEVRYDSRTGAKPPPGFETAARSVGVPLATMKMNTQGKLLERKRHEVKDEKNKSKKAAQPESDVKNDAWVTIPLPEEAVPVGHTWSIPQDIEIPLPSGMVKKVKAIQKFVLEEVKTGVATIQVSTEILTPITDPAVESQLVQREVSGRVRFDIDAGRILDQRMDIDKHVVGFRGGASSLHYVNRFTERLVTEPVKTAEKPGKKG